MTASAGAWYRVGTVNVINSQQAVTGVGTNWQNDVISIAVGDIFTLDAKTWYEVTAVNSDTSITLDRDYEGSTENAANYAIVRNTSGTILTRIAGQISVQFNQKQLFLDELRAWLNSDNASEELTDSHGVKQSLKTPAQMVRDHDDKLAKLDSIHPHPWAMRKVEFEARRAANNEKFAASGWVHKGKNAEAGTNNNAIGDGLDSVTASTFANSLRLGRSIDAIGNSKTDYPVLNIAGVITNVLQVSIINSDRAHSKIKLPPAEDGTRTYDSTTGVSVTHATSAIAFASETATNKVVTDRVDMWGFEGFLREINDTDPFVYKNGLIQSQAPDINGVGTVLDNVRPITYFAWYTGDTTSRGKGVNWQTATESQRIAIASDPDNNIYFDDSTGKFYQWCLCGRSFAGLDNGDWKNLTPNQLDSGTNTEYGHNGGKSQIRAQGLLDEVSGSYRYLMKLHTQSTIYNSDPAIAEVQAAAKGVTSAAGTKSVLLACGTINRLNQGAYHPSFNPSGSSTFWDAAGSISSNLPFTDSRITKPTSKSDCFNFQVGSVANRGSIATGVSGRPDGRYYDAIYASGQGGVCRDMRYSAWGLKAEDFAEAGLKIKASKYRGREVLRKFAPAETLGSSYYYNSNNLVAIYGSNIETDRDLCLGDIIWVKPQDAPRYYSVKIIEFASTYIKARLLNEESPISDGVAPNTQIPSEYWLPQYIETSISDEYTHTEVIGKPSEILRCEDLKNGWVGGWNPVLPSTSAKDYDLTRPSLSVPVIKESTDLGSSWTEITTGTWDSLENAFVGKAMQSTDTIWLLTYKSKAKLTTDSIKGVVHGGDKGLGDVYVCSWGGLYNQGRDLGYSLISKVLVGANSYSRNMTYKLSQGGVDSSGQFPTSVNYPIKHTVVDINSVESPAFKALNYNSVENQQGFINYAYTELHYDSMSGDWGDDGEIHIANNQTTMPDENGHTVLVGTARCVEPIGWIKNDK